MKPPPERENSSHQSSEVDDDHQNGRGSTNGNGNHSNHREMTEVHEDHMFGAIDRFLGSSEQTYEQFVQCFSYFTPGAQDTNSAETSQNQSHEPGLRTDPTPQRVEAPAVEHQQNPTHDTEEGLEEELLAEGTRIPEMLMRSDDGVRSRPLVKFGNFVEDVEDDGSSDEEYQPYVASFGQAEGNNEEESANCHSDLTKDNVKNETACDELCETDLVTNKDNMGDSKSLPLECEATTIGHYDSTGILITDPPHQCTSSLSDSKDDEDELCYDASQDLPNPGEISECESSANSLQLSSNLISANVRQLDYSTKIKESPEVTEICRNNDRTETLVGQPSSDVPSFDAVEAFSLDEDFDYDNVVLTPKYTPEEMALIQGVVRLGPVFPAFPTADEE